jgi:uncharacterized protein (DUF1684 family)
MVRDFERALIILLTFAVAPLAAQQVSSVAVQRVADHTATAAYEQEIEQFRRKLESDVRKNWVTLVGLHWLKPGRMTLGSSDDNDIQLPLPAPAHAGYLDIAGEGSKQTVTLHAAHDAKFVLNGKPITNGQLKPDSSGKYDLVHLGTLEMLIHGQPGEFALRVRDTSGQRQRNFAGLQFFPTDPEYRVSAHFEPYENGRKLHITDVTGRAHEMPLVGRVSFKLQGRDLTLDALSDSEDGKLFLIFRDLTTGKETYPVGRYLDTEVPQNGSVVLDFNKAYTPPCAFTPYATCPIPPKQNRLDAAIRAGEKGTGH